MKIEKMKLADLRPLEKNVRKHGEKQIEEFVKSLEVFGQTRPFVVDEENTILIGNGMFEAMKLAGFEKCDVFRIKGLSELQKKKLVLTDNKIYSLGADNLDNIMDYLQEFADAGEFDLPGFDEEGIKALTRTAEEILDDAMDYGHIETESPVGKAAQRAAWAEGESPRPETMAETLAEEAAPGEAAESAPAILCPNCGEVIRR